MGLLGLPAAFGLRLPLRDYQWAGVAYLLDRESALLADEMGLGKTIQTIIALRIALRQERVNRVLIVTPRSLGLNWLRELAAWAPSLAVNRIIGDQEDRLAGYRLPVPVLLATYEQIRQDSRHLNTLFDIVILDEAQRIKNMNSDTALGCRLVRRSRAWALTGTPIENHQNDLRSIYRFLKPGLLESADTFYEIKSRIKPYFLRRTRDAVLPELPPVVEQTISVELTSEQRRRYDLTWDTRLERVRGGRRQGETANILALITRLKQICNYDPVSGESAKLDVLRDIVSSLGGNDKLLVFSQFVETLEWLATTLDLPLAVFHGGLPEHVRDRTLDEFRNSRGRRALLASLRAGGVGLNLQETTVVVMFDRWWNPAVEMQAVSRAQRFGRSSPLLAYTFVVENSIEGRIQQLLEEKSNLAKQIVDSAEGAEDLRLTAADLRRLIELPEADPLADTPGTLL